MTNRLARTTLLGIACIGLAPFGDAVAARKEKVREEVAVIDTNLGKFAFRFFSQESPRTVEAFKKLVRAGFYNGTLVHGVLPGLLIQDRKSTRLNSSHVSISYAVFCLKKKNNIYNTTLGNYQISTHV